MATSVGLTGLRRQPNAHGPRPEPLQALWGAVFASIYVSSPPAVDAFQPSRRKGRRCRSPEAAGSPVGLAVSNTTASHWPVRSFRHPSQTKAFDKEVNILLLKWAPLSNLRNREFGA